MILRRFIFTDYCTIGKLWLPNGYSCFTLERPWLNNQPFVSCIPTGSYDLVWDHQGRIREVPMLVDVPGRSHICIHPATNAWELQGCIAPCVTYGTMDSGKTFFGNSSRNAMDMILEYTGQPTGIHNDPLPGIQLTVEDFSTTLPRNTDGKLFQDHRT